jgi:hypothetical protein
MKIKYFQDTDTLYIEFRPGEVAEANGPKGSGSNGPGQIYEQTRTPLSPRLLAMAALQSARPRGRLEGNPAHC